MASPKSESSSNDTIIVESNQTGDENVSGVSGGKKRKLDETDSSSAVVNKEDISRPEDGSPQESKAGTSKPDKKNLRLSPIAHKYEDISSDAMTPSSGSDLTPEETHRHNILEETVNSLKQENMEFKKTVGELGKDVNFLKLILTEIRQSKCTHSNDTSGADAGSSSKPNGKADTHPNESQSNRQQLIDNAIAISDNVYGENNKCDHCDESGFKSVDDLKKHLKEAHGIENE